VFPYRSISGGGEVGSGAAGKTLDLEVAMHALRKFWNFRPKSEWLFQLQLSGWMFYTVYTSQTHTVKCIIALHMIVQWNLDKYK